MKLKLVAISALGTFAANAQTTVNAANFSGTTTGAPIVDNTGSPIASGSLSWVVGSFDPAFDQSQIDALTSDDDAIIAANFVADSPSQTFTFDGLFNGSVGGLDAGNTLIGEDVYIAIGNNADFALADNFIILNMGAAWPEQNPQGAIDLGRSLDPGDITVGDLADNVKVDELFGPFAGNANFSRGIRFDAIPEPSTGLLSLIAGLGLLARRRR